MATRHAIRTALSGTALGRVTDDPRITAPLVAIGINLALGVSSCIAYHTMTGQQFAPDPLCIGVYAYTSLSTLVIGVVGTTRYDQIPGRSPLGKALVLAAATWLVFVAASFLPGSSSLARRGVAPTTAYYAVAALAAMGGLVYARERVSS